MDPLAKKRKLIDFGTNIVSPKEQKFAKTLVGSIENDCRISRKIQKIRTINTVNTENQSLFNVSQVKTLQKLELPLNCCGKKKQDEKLEPITKIYHGEKNKEIYLVSDNDGKDPLWFSTDYIEDIISYEIHKESLYHLSDSFCKKYDINPMGREILIDWLIRIQVHLKAENSTLHLAVALLDIMLDNVHILFNELQGAAIAAFWVAYKFIHGNMSIKTLLNICAGSVTKEMIEDNEILVLQTSRLIRAGGSLTVFVNYILYQIFGFKFPPEIYYCSLYFIEVMLLQFIFVDYRAYEKAVIAVFTSLSLFGCTERLNLLDVSKFITKQKLCYGYRRLRHSLKFMYIDKDGLKNSSVFRKYKSSRYYKISTHPNLKCLAAA